MSANSIIQFYLNTANTTANSSQHDLSKIMPSQLPASPEMATTPASLLKTNNSNNIIFKKIEQLPTPAAESNLSVSPGEQQVKTGSGVPSFFSIPLRFFASKKSTPKLNDDELDKEIDDFKKASPIDVIKDSPTDIFSDQINTGDEVNQTDSVERTNSNMLKSENDGTARQSDLLSGDYDPIYDTYITYINHTTPEGDLIL